MAKGYEEEVAPWSRVSNLDAAKRGPASVLQMGAQAQKISTALVTPKLIAVDGAKGNYDGI